MCRRTCDLGGGFAARTRPGGDVHRPGSHGGPRGAGERASGRSGDLLATGEGEVRRGRGEGRWM